MGSFYNGYEFCEDISKLLKSASSVYDTASKDKNMQYPELLTLYDEIKKRVKSFKELN